MKFILNKDTLDITENQIPNSGSINYYEAEVEFDESWNNLTIEAVLVNSAEEIANSVAVINNKFFIDRKIRGAYKIGFVGYTFDGDKKNYQISTNLKSICIKKGAGEIETENENLPSPTEWEIYVAQIKSIVSDIEGLSESLINQVSEVERKLADGEFNGTDGKDGITPTIGEDGNWYLGEQNTGKPSRGEKGETGQDGKDGQDGKNYEITQKDYEAIAKVVDVPHNTSQLTNDSGFITKEVDNLTNYTDTDTLNNDFAKKEEIPDTSNFITKDVTDLANYTDTETLNNRFAKKEDIPDTKSLITKNTEQDKAIDNLKNKDTELEGALQELQKKDTSIDEEIKNITAKNEEQDSDISNIKEEQKTQNTQIEANRFKSEQNSSEIDSLKTKDLEKDKAIENLTNKVEEIAKFKGHVYTIRRKISENTATTWERLDDAKDMVANATKDGGVVRNDFDNVSPWKDIISFNLDLATGKKKAYFGDADFKFNGENGDVYTHIPTFWYKIWKENDYIYASIADYARSGYAEMKEFDIQRYHGSITSDGKIHSYSGLIPSYDKTLPAFRTLAQALGKDYCLLDWRYFAIQLLYLVEYADYNSQSTLGNGMTNFRLNGVDVALVAENNVNKFVVNTTGGNAFVVGQTISIGSKAATFEVAEGREITAITDYDKDSIVGKEITFDGDPVNIALKNVIWSSPQREGGCDVLGMKSGCIVNDGKHGVIYRGIENFIGNICNWVDGLNINEYEAYICYNPEFYDCNKYDAPYEKIGYVDASEGGYIKKLGFDINNPLIQLPTEIGGSSSTGIADNYYTSTGDNSAFVGGTVYHGEYAGFWCWFLNASSSKSYWTAGARVLKYQ